MHSAALLELAERLGGDSQVSFASNPVRRFGLILSDFSIALMNLP